MIKMEAVTKLITKELTLGQILNEHPEVVETLSEYGLHCFGCSVNTMETLEEGFAAHGLTSEQLDEALDRANKVATEKPDEPDFDISKAEVNLSDFAAAKIKELIEKEQPKPQGIGKIKSMFKKPEKVDMHLRVEVVTGGCSGHVYMFALDTEKREDDVVFDKHGVKIVLDPESLKMLNKSTIDYNDSMQGAGFVVHNPNATKSCGCGKSFR